MVLDSGQNERLKAGWRAAIGVLVGVAAVYNLLAYARRKAPHLAVNAALYAGLTGYEVVKTWHHVESRRDYAE